MRSRASELAATVRRKVRLALWLPTHSYIGKLDFPCRASGLASLIPLQVTKTRHTRALTIPFGKGFGSFATVGISRYSATAHMTSCTYIFLVLRTKGRWIECELKQSGFGSKNLLPQLSWYKRAA